MKETKRISKWFWLWDFEKEERWLNEMAQAGWALCSVGWCVYDFEKCLPGEYIVRLEMHEADAAYLSFMRETGAEYIGRVTRWIYFRRKSELGSFDLFSDMDSRIGHLDRIGKFVSLLAVANLCIGVGNSLNSSHSGWINLLLTSLLTYGLGRIHGKKDVLTEERRLHE